MTRLISKQPVISSTSTTKSNISTLSATLNRVQSSYLESRPLNTKPFGTQLGSDTSKTRISLIATYTTT